MKMKCISSFLWQELNSISEIKKTRKGLGDTSRKEIPSVFPTVTCIKSIKLRNNELKIHEMTETFCK